MKYAQQVHDAAPFVRAALSSAVDAGVKEGDAYAQHLTRDLVQDNVAALLNSAHHDDPREQCADIGVAVVMLTALERDLAATPERAMTAKQLIDELLDAHRAAYSDFGDASDEAKRDTLRREVLRRLERAI